MPNDPATIRSLIIHENEMINHRMTWFLVLQGFMLTGIAFGWEKSRELCGVFACIGMLSSLSVGILLRLRTLTLEKLEGLNNTEERVMGRGANETNIFLKFLLPWHLLPLVFAIGWIVIFLIKAKMFF